MKLFMNVRYHFFPTEKWSSRKKNSTLDDTLTIAFFVVTLLLSLLDLLGNLHF